MGNLSLEKLNKYYGSYHALKDLSIDIADKEFLVLVGPSGCGKSTALRMIAGLEEISGGVLRINGEEVNDVRSSDRDIAMVFQNYALYPHMSVYDNIAFSLQIRKHDRSDIDERVQEAARVLQLQDHLKRRPGQLSGGQRQRVAMGRAIVRRPQIFLMDEPLSNLDAKLRVQMRAEIASLQRRLGVTTIYVTHDQIEAMTMGDRVAVMHDGELQQVAPPTEIYEHPANTFVASFIGSPSMNLLFADLSINGESGSLQIGAQSIPVTSKTLAARPGLGGYANRRIILGIRPEQLSDAELSPADSVIEGEVYLRESLGSDAMIYFTINAEKAEVISPDSLESLPATANGDQTICVARFDPASNTEVKSRQKIGVRLDGLYYFDAETGEAIY